MVIELKGYITIKEAARLCHRNPETVRRWVWSGKLPAEKIGNQLLVRQSDIGHFCTNKSAAGTQAARIAALERAITVAESIYQHSGKIDVLKALDESRDSHPYPFGNDDRA